MSVTEFFGEFDITINQAYGMSECTGVSTMTTDGRSIFTVVVRCSQST